MMVDKRSDTTSGQAAVPPTLSLQLAEHVAGFRLDDVPLHIVRKAKRNLSTTLRHRRFLFTDSFLLLWKWRVG